MVFYTKAIGKKKKMGEGKSHPPSRVFVRSALNGSFNGAYAGAGAALDALVGIDLELAVALCDSVYGTFCSASAACDASVGDFISHDKYLHNGIICGTHPRPTVIILS